MKLLRTALFMIAASLLANTAVGAEAVSVRAKVLKKQLNLTDEQTQELDKIYRETRAKQTALRQQMRDLYDEQEKRTKALLKPEQAKKYEEMTREVPEGEAPEIPQLEGLGTGMPGQHQEPAPPPAK